MDLRRFAADTFAMTIFSTVIGVTVEVFIAGLTIEQSARVRFAAIPVNLLAGRPYGVYRDWLFGFIGEKPAGRLTALAMDSLANITFQIPLYAILLLINGASVNQILAAAGSVIVISTLSGRPYGLFLVLCRRLFHA